jgi:predicted DNA-binding protein with PD1-like motif
LEVTGFLGTTTDEGAHVHGSLAGRDFQAMGGHLAHAIANPMLEVFITPTGKLSRTMNEHVKLKLLDL